MTEIVLDQDVLVRNGFVAVPANRSTDSALYAPINLGVATVIQNMATYGYVVDRKAYDAMLSSADLPTWWKGVETVLKAISGADRNMDEHVIYKNFPREVLEMSRAESVIKQILIYWGVPYDYLREDERERPPLGDIKRLKVLTLADENTADRIFSDLMKMSNRWSDNQTEWADRLIGTHNAVVASDFGFKENAIGLAARHFATVEFVASSATDVMRLAAALSGADVSLRERVKFRHFKHAERRRLLAALESQSGVEDDMAMRPEPWKRLIEHLRPGDYTPKYQNVEWAFNELYNKQAKSFNALVDPQMPTEAALVTVATRPGEFLRRFHHFYGLFGQDAVDRFLPVIDKLTTRQLANFRAYLRTINERTSLIYPPRSNWARVQVAANEKTAITPEHRRMINSRISRVLTERLGNAFPNGISLDMRVDAVRLQANDQKLAEYGRGTEFDIPPDATFVRSASYWENDPLRGVTYYDNGWNFFDENWTSLGACAWNAQHFGHGKSYAAVFSGDPVNTRDLRGRACQMADLYLDRMEEAGVRYAVWNLLCYSRVPFSSAKEVLATLQWGEDAEVGKKYEPARAQMVFPIRSETYTNYVAYIDVRRRKLVYMDAALPAGVQSATYNGDKLEKLMPAYVEYLAAQPTLLDVLQDAPMMGRRHDSFTHVLFDDANVPINGGRAYVFQPVNSDNSFERLSITDLINV